MLKSDNVIILNKNVSFQKKDEVVHTKPSIERYDPHRYGIQPRSCSEIFTHSRYL